MTTTTITFVGEENAGKSTLMNNLLGFKICMTKKTCCTRCICKFKYDKKKDKTSRKIKSQYGAEVKKKISNINEQDGDYTEVEFDCIFSGLAHEKLCREGITICDTPGLPNETPLEMLNNPLFKKIKNCIKESTVVVLLIPVDQVDTESDSRALGLIDLCRTLNSRVLVILSKVDYITKKPSLSGDEDDLSLDSPPEEWDPERVEVLRRDFQAKVKIPVVSICEEGLKKGDMKESLIKSIFEYNTHRTTFMKEYEIIHRLLSERAMLPFKKTAAYMDNYGKHRQKVVKGLKIIAGAGFLAAGGMALIGGVLMLAPLAISAGTITVTTGLATSAVVGGEITSTFGASALVGGSAFLAGLGAFGTASFSSVTLANAGKITKDIKKRKWDDNAVKSLKLEKSMEPLVNFYHFLSNDENFENAYKDYKPHDMQDQITDDYLFIPILHEVMVDKKKELRVNYYKVSGQFRNREFLLFNDLNRLEYVGDKEIEEITLPKPLRIRVKEKDTFLSAVFSSKAKVYEATTTKIKEDKVSQFWFFDEKNGYIYSHLIQTLVITVGNKSLTLDTPSESKKKYQTWKFDEGKFTISGFLETLTPEYISLDHCGIPNG